MRCIFVASGAYGWERWWRRTRNEPVSQYRTIDAMCIGFCSKDDESMTTTRQCRCACKTATRSKSIWSNRAVERWFRITMSRRTRNGIDVNDQNKVSYLWRIIQLFNTSMKISISSFMYHSLTNELSWRLGFRSKSAIMTSRVCSTWYMMSDASDYEIVASARCSRQADFHRFYVLNHSRASLLWIVYKIRISHSFSSFMKQNFRQLLLAFAAPIPKAFPKPNPYALGPPPK